MQTFLPYPSFVESARVLDRARLGKQRVEALQVLRAITVPDYGWRHHPAAKMWRGYVPALAEYALAMTDEWIRQGHPDTIRAQVLEFAPHRATAPDPTAPDPTAPDPTAPDPTTQDAPPPHALLDLPPWLGDEAFHLSHQSNLVRKDRIFYAPLFPGVPDDLPYVWPPATQEGETSTFESGP